MTGDAWLTLAVLAAALVLLATDRLPPSAVVVAATVTLLVTDVIDAAAALSGFSNPAPITVAALYVLARAAEKTGLLAPVTSWLLGESGGPRALARLLVPAAGASAFFNNTPLVAMLIPDLVSWADRHRLAASHYLMPLSFAAILGGAVTVLGTSTNLVVSGLLQEAGQPPLGLFEITAVGGPVAVAGLLVLLLAAWRLVPERRTAHQQAEEELRHFVVAMSVEPGGPLDGRTIAEAGLRQRFGVFAVEIVRAGHSIVPVGPQSVLEGGDTVVFVGRVDQIVELQRASGLGSAGASHLDEVAGPDHTFYEVVVGRTSPLAGRSVSIAEFATHYQAAVVAIHRDGRRVRERIESERLRVGDTLLVLAGPEFQDNWKDRRDFLVIARRGGSPPHVTRQAPVVGAIALAMVLLAALDVVPILEGALLAAGALVVTRVLSANEVRDAIDFDVIILIGAAFGLGAAVETTGLAALLADGLVGGLEGLGVGGIVFGVLLATVLLTEIVTNNAAAVVVFPIAVSVATAAGLDARTVAMAVAVAASSSFLTPIGYQTNTMVYGPGGYRFGDYARVGGVITVTVLVVLTTVVVLAG